MCLVVAAAGNSESDVPEFPAAARGVVAVGATDAGGHRTTFSNYGPWVDVNAPGVNLLTTKPKTGGFTTASGTSAATALVAGVAVLLRAAHPRATQADIADRLRRSAFGRGPVGAEDIDASGVVDAAAALRLPDRPPPSGPASDGYVMIGSNGKVDVFGDVGYSGDSWGDMGRSRALNLEAGPSGTGYWILNRDGRVAVLWRQRLRRDDGLTTRAEVEQGRIDMSALPDGIGILDFHRYRTASSPAGRHKSYGDLAGVHLDRPIVAGCGHLDRPADTSWSPTTAVSSPSATPALPGRWSGQPLNAPDPVHRLGRRRRRVLAGFGLDGGVFAFRAPFRGSLGSEPLTAPIVGMVGLRDGYFLVAADGGRVRLLRLPLPRRSG